ncbi:glycoside hydrolase family 16 protein [Moniliophthora roreri]|nr:glycoside hydrolase family 16 protein [Moniliophthora roreri]
MDRREWWKARSVPKCTGPVNVTGLVPDSILCSEQTYSTPCSEPSLTTSDLRLTCVLLPRNRSKSRKNKNILYYLPTRLLLGAAVDAGKIMDTIQVGEDEAWDRMHTKHFKDFNH